METRKAQVAIFRKRFFWKAALDSIICIEMLFDSNRSFFLLLFAKYHGKMGASTKKVFLEVVGTLTSLTLVGTIIDPTQITSFLFLLLFLNLLIIFLVYRG